RMLALPVNPTEVEPAPEFPVLATEPELSHEEDAAAGEEASAWQPGEPAVETIRPETSAVQATPAAANRTDPTEREEPSVAVLPGPFPGVRTPAILNRARVRGWRLLAPVAWINRTFDTWTARLGRPGRWLRSRQGRALLGALGILFLLAAFGWTIFG